jgi:MFS family permease
MTFRGKLANSYWASALLVICALVPYLGLSSALGPMIPTLSKGVHLSSQALSLTFGMSNAAYALGTVLSVQLAVHYPQRRLLVSYAAIFTFGSVLSATAWTPGLFIAGHVLQGLMTSMMLIAAAPALVTGWPPKRLATTAMVMNLGIFGAVGAGPVVGGLEANAQSWRPLFWIVCGVGALALLLAVLTFEDTPAIDRAAPRDWAAILLAGFGCAATFFGAAELETHSMLSLIVIAPLLAGAGLILLLLIHQVTAKAPLMPMRQLLHTIPIAAVVVAVSAGASSVTLIELTQTALAHSTSPAHLGVLFLPELGGAVFTAFLFGALIRTRYAPALALSGLVFIAGGAAVLTGAATGPDSLVLVGSGLVGLGLGCSVAPALFSTAFSLRVTQLPRVFAMLELLRGTAAFAAAPIILHLAMTAGGSTTGGIQISIWVCFAIAAGGAIVSLYVYILGRARLQVPDISKWETAGGPAWDSPPLAAGIRASKPASDNAGLSDPSSPESARVEALALALQIAHSDD